MRKMLNSRPTPLLLVAAVLCAGLLSACGSDEVLVTIRDQNNEPVAGVEIRQAGREERLGVTDDAGQASVSPDRSGEVALRLSPPAGAETPYEFDSSYRVTDDNFRIGKMFIRAREGRSGGMSTASLEVTSEPAGAVIYLNGAVAGTTNVLLTGLPTGLNQIALVLEGAHADSSRIFLEAGDNPPHHRDLTAIAVTTGTLRVESDPAGASVQLDGRDTGKKTPATLRDIEAGSYRVKVSRSGYQDFQTRVTVKAGQDALVDAGPLTQRSAPPAGGGGSGGGSGGGGTPSSGGGGSTPPAGGGGTTPPAGGGSPPPDTDSRDTFQKSYTISPFPGWAEVYVDDDPRNRAITGPFKMNLTSGEHLFRVVNNQAGVNVVLKYTVKRGDRNSKLLLNYETRQVVAKP